MGGLVLRIFVKDFLKNSPELSTLFSFNYDSATSKNDNVQMNLTAQNTQKLIKTFVLMTNYNTFPISFLHSSY